MTISLVLCTYNRAGSIGISLESILASIVPRGVEWEVLVVDNNSKDETHAVIEGFSRLHPGRIQYLFEPKQGLSNARNAGIRAARGAVVAFTDDDVTVDPQWLHSLTQPLLDDQCAGTGGRILLGDFCPPSWLAISGPHNLGGSLVQFDLGDQPILLDKAPFGACMAFQKSVFEKFGWFRTDLGRSGTSLIGNEDTEFGMRLIAGGLRLLYVPQAVVYHPVLKERLNKMYFRKYWFGLGRSMVRQRGVKVPFWKVPRVYLKEFRQRLHWMKVEDRHWHKSSQGRFYCEVHALQALGQVIESWNQSLRFSRMPGHAVPPKSDLTEKAG